MLVMEGDRLRINTRGKDYMRTGSAVGHTKRGMVEVEFDPPGSGEKGEFWPSEMFVVRQAGFLRDDERTRA